MYAKIAKKLVMMALGRGNEACGGFFSLSIFV